MGQHFRISRKQRLIATIVISFIFFVTELVVGFLTKSLALVADAFHYLNDLIGFVVALSALMVSEREDAPAVLSYGWDRASTVGAFFNGVFLLALGVSILLQSAERFISLQRVQDPFLVLIVGSVGLGLNIISILFLHEHDHGNGHDHGHGHDDGHGHGQPEAATAVVVGQGSSGSDLDMMSFPLHHEHKHNSTPLKSPGRDLGMLAVLVHVVGDAINNIGVIISAVIIWKTHSEGRFYADPAVSMFIALMILISSWPLVKHSGYILLQGAPVTLKLDDVKHDLEKIPGIESVHELHVWRLDQNKSIASVHVVVSDKSVSNFMEKARTIGECLHAYGIHSVTLQPELHPYGAVSTTTEQPHQHQHQPQQGLQPQEPQGPQEMQEPQGPQQHEPQVPQVPQEPQVQAQQQQQPQQLPPRSSSPADGSVSSATRHLGWSPKCQLICGSVCENMMCCTQMNRG